MHYCFLPMPFILPAPTSRLPPELTLLPAHAGAGEYHLPYIANVCAAHGAVGILIELFESVYGLLFAVVAEHFHGYAIAVLISHNAAAQIEAPANKGKDFIIKGVYFRPQPFNGLFRFLVCHAFLPCIACRGLYEP